EFNSDPARDLVFEGGKMAGVGTHAHPWGGRVDRAPRGLVRNQNEITSRIAVELQLELVGVEAARPTVHLNALDYILRGRAALNRPSARNNYADAVGLFENAMVLDSESVDAQAFLALALTGGVLDQMSE